MSYLSLSTATAAIVAAIAIAVSSPARAQAPGCAAGANCVENQRTGATYATLAAAYEAAQPGDMLNINPATTPYTDHDILDGISLTWIGDGPPGSVVIDPASANGLVTKGILVVGAVGTFPNVTVENIVFQDAAQSRATTATTCNGVSIAAGALTQCHSAGNAAGIRYQSGNLTVTDSYFYHDDDGIIGDPFIHGTGSITVEDSYADQDGAGDGQSHNFYLGRVSTVTFIGNTSCNAWTGHTLKIRAVSATVQGNALGDCPQIAGPSIIGGDWDGVSSNEAQFGDGTAVTMSGNTLVKATTASNPYPVEFGGQLPPWAGASFTETGDTLEDNYGVPALVWNFLNSANVSITNNTITGSKTPKAVLVGMGSQSGNGSFAATSETTYPVLAGGLTLPPADNYQGTGAAETVTLATGLAVLGGNGALTVTGSAANTEVFGGPGGSSVTANTDFVDSAGDSPSTYTGVPPAMAELVANGDTANITGESYGYVDLSGQNETLNLNGTGSACPAVFVKSGVTGFVPSATINQNATCTSKVLIIAGGTVNLTGQRGVPLLEGYAAPGVAAADATYDINLANGEAATITGQGFEISGLRVYDYTDPVTATHDLFEPTGPAAWTFYLRNSTIDYGSSTGSTAEGPEGSAASALFAAAIAGSGTGTFITGAGPGVIEVIAGHGGGTLTVNNYNAAHAADYPIVFLGGAVEASCTASGTTDTLVSNDGTTLVLPGAVACSKLNLTPPPGFDDATLAGSAITVTTGGTVPLGLSLADQQAASMSGEGLIRLTAQSGGTVTLNGATGATEQMKGRMQDILPALAAATYTAPATGGADTVLAQWWNQGGGTASVSQVVSITAASSSIGTCYNGITQNVPPPQGPTLDLRPYMYSHCNITISNETIIDSFQNGQLVVAGNNNSIDMVSTTGSYLGSQAHKDMEIIGNNNVASAVDGHANGNIVVNGTGNTIWSGGFVSEMMHGNTIIAPFDGGFYWTWVGGIQGQSIFDPSGAAPDTINLIPILQAHGCTSPTNNPACASSGAAYDSFAPNNAGAPGVHNYCVTGAGCSAQNPFEMWVDCTGQTNTMAAFVGNAHIITGGAAPTPLPAYAPPATITWPSGIPATLGAQNISFLGSMSYTAGAYDSGGAAGFGSSFIDIFDPWAYANSGTDTVTLSAAHGYFPNASGAGVCGQVGSNVTCFSYQNTPQAVHEYLVGTRYQPLNASVTSDTITVTLTNSGGGSYTATFPLAVQQGNVCPAGP